jgi:dUTP pyrophosphatase
MIFENVGYNVDLGFYKVNGDVISDPSFATDGSACFDLRADLTKGVIKGFTDQDREISLGTCGTGADRKLVLPLSPKDRWMIPTGLIFDIPEGFHIAVYMRGGTGLKRGLRLANGTGIIDSDFVHETHLLLQNLSGGIITISHNERLCQGIVRRNVSTNLKRISEPPAQKTERAGGYNSTGRS